MGMTKLDETYISKISIKNSISNYISKFVFFRVLVTIEPGHSLLQFVTTNCLRFLKPNLDLLPCIVHSEPVGKCYVILRYIDTHILVATNISPLKTSIHFPINITICKNWSKFVTCSPSHRDCEGVSRPQRHSFFIRSEFRILGEFWSSDFGKISSVGGGLGALQFFQSLKKGTRTFHLS